MSVTVSHEQSWFIVKALCKHGCYLNNALGNLTQRKTGTDECKKWSE